MLLRARDPIVVAGGDSLPRSLSFLQGFYISPNPSSKLAEIGFVIPPQKLAVVWP